MRIDNLLKPPPIDRFKQLSKDAIGESHARPLSESRQPESIRFAPDWSGMSPRHSESFPGQPCASRGRDQERACDLVEMSEWTPIPPTPRRRDCGWRRGAR